MTNCFHLAIPAGNIKTALKFYCDKELTDAHTAIADANATLDVLLAQLDRYSELEPNVDFLNHVDKDYLLRRSSPDVNWEFIEEFSPGIKKM